MQLRAISIAVLLIAVLSAAGAHPGLREENKLLESELKLAKKSGIYFVFNLDEKKVSIKAKAMTLREMPIAGERLWGGRPPIAPLKLVKKSALLKPKRTEIKPKKEEDSDEQAGSDTFEIDALELKDMPSSYRLVLSEGVRVSIKPKAEGFFSRLLDIPGTIFWYIIRPLESAWNALLGRPFSAVEIEMSKQDARRLYWSFPEGNEAIVYKAGK